MLIFSHIWFSQAIEESLWIESYEDYYLWSILPDIRYMNWSERSLTHIDPEKVNDLLDTLSPSFLLWYKTHLLLDIWAGPYWIYEKTRALFPRWIQKKLSWQLLNIFFEVYFFQKIKEQDTLKISQSYSKKLISVWVIEKDFYEYSSSIQRVFDTMTFDEWVKVVGKNPKLSWNKKIQLYMKLWRRCMKIPFVKEYIAWKTSPVIEEAKYDFTKHIQQLSI